MLKAISALIISLPEIIKFIKNLQEHIEKANKQKKKEESERRLKEDIKKINEAFKTNDINKLNDVFDNSLSEYGKADKS